MLADELQETLRVPELHIPHLSDSTSATGNGNPPSHRRRRFRMRRSRPARNPETAATLDCAGNLEYLQLPSIEITPSSDEDSALSNPSTPSTSPRRHGLRLKSWGSAKESSEMEVLGNSGSRYVPQHDLLCFMPCMCVWHRAPPYSRLHRGPAGTMPIYSLSCASSSCAALAFLRLPSRRSRGNNSPTEDANLDIFVSMATRHHYRQ